MPLKRALVMVLLFALGCLGPVAPLAAQEAATVSGPLPGTWLVGGFGASGQRWNAFLEIKADTSGRFMWKSDRGETGKETFHGIAYDETTRTVRIVGGGASGDVAAATYTAKLSADGRRMTDGSWTGTPASPGKWMAVFVVSRPLEKDIYPDF